MTEPSTASFVVRLIRDSRRQVSDVIERVATGAKEAFQGAEAIGPMIADMLQREGAGPLARRTAPASRGAGAIGFG